MHDGRRKLIMTLAGGDSRAFPLIHSLEGLVRRDEIYAWLIRNGLTGSRFVEFCKERGLSMLRIGKYVLSRVDTIRKEELVVGKDLI